MVVAITQNQLFRGTNFLIFCSLQDLLNGGENGKDKWNLNELVVAMAYLCHFHALASFVLGCGLLNEPPKQELAATMASNSSSKDQDLEEKVSEILKKMEYLMSHKEELGKVIKVY